MNGLFQLMAIALICFGCASPVRPDSRCETVDYIQVSQNSHQRLADEMGTTRTRHAEGYRTSDDYLDEMDAVLRHDVLGVWFPRSVDKESGGFYSNFARDWQPARSDGKFSVFQGRMTWVAARIVIARPDLKDRFLPIIDHGMKYLSEVLWDKQHGGFFWGLDDTGKIAPQFTDGKDLYGMSFGLYGAAAAYQ
ncbi:MAG: hypothetical protein DMF74_05770, partial [Acidobacteria bacterium]